MPLDTYQKKRRFDRTPEPQGEQPEASGERLSFVVQKHDARRLHFDFRLEWGGVLWSWAVPKGPSLDPGQRRLAVRTEDHPLAYRSFEGLIPEGQYGAGPVIVWDHGEWVPDGDPEAAMHKGHLVFTLHGTRLTGRWNLVRIEAAPRESWLLIKGRDDVADAKLDLVAKHPDSVVSHRTLDDVRARPSRVWEGGADAPAVAPDVDGAEPAPLPDRIAPMIPSAVKTPPPGDGWLHEIKYDGYRLGAHVREGAVRLVTRNGQDWTERFLPVADALSRLPVESAVVDGELVVLDAEGASDFGALQQALSTGDTSALRFVAFDLPYLEGHDLRQATLRDRKALLRRLLDASPSALVRYSDHVEGDGATFHEHACRLGLEGIVSKQADAPYQSGRTRSWRKVKCLFRQDFVVVGWVPSDEGLGALVLGVNDTDGLRCVGKVGTGFSAADRRDLARSLTGEGVSSSPLCDDEEIPGARWVAPRRVAEVAFTGWTRSGRLRHPSFKGFRDDKDPADVRRDPAEDPRGLEGVAAPTRTGRAALARVRITSPDRILYPDLDVTKAELLAYWASVVDRAMPFLADRPLTLVRCPDGVGDSCFFQKHADVGLPDEIERVDVPGHDAPLLVVRTPEALLACAQVSALELHPWSARTGDLDHPDMALFDLDPEPGTPWTRIAETAWRLRDRLGSLGLEAFPRVTGGHGIHVVVPLSPVHGWDAVRGFTEAVADALVRETPDRLTRSHAKKGRRGRLYIDVLRNVRGATAIGTWSTRARASAGVCVPLGWDEVAGVGRGDRFDLRTVHGRLAAMKHDPWAGFFDLGQELPDDVEGRLGQVSR